MFHWCSCSLFLWLQETNNMKTLYRSEMSCVFMVLMSVTCDKDDLYTIHRREVNRGTVCTYLAWTRMSVLIASILFRPLRIYTFTTYRSLNIAFVI